MQLPIINKLTGTIVSDQGILMISHLATKLLEWTCYAVIFGCVALFWIGTP